MSGRGHPEPVSGLSPSECITLQKSLAGSVSLEWDGREVRTVTGTDVHFPARDTARAAAAVFTFPGLELIETAVASAPCPMPYIPGLLSFREIPALLAVIGRLASAGDVILCDGQGIAHPRGLGLASHLGLILDTPTVGCAKSRLFGSCEEPGGSKGERSKITGRDGEVIGCVLRTRKDIRPVYVSPGHRIDLETAARLVLDCSPRFRIPVPLRKAHQLAGS